MAPIALYPDALIAQILAASTYPTQIVDADRWMQAHTGITAKQIASKVNGQSWDPSVKALTAFPTVLAQLDKNLDWTMNLGNAYYNQPKDVMNEIHAMRERAEASGNLKSNARQTVSGANGNMVIAPANPGVAYVPVYNPWVVYGAPLAVYPGFYYAPPPGTYFGDGLAIGFTDLIYAGEQVRRVEYNEANRLWLHKVIAEVSTARTLPRITRNHQMPGRCSGCGLRQQCDQSLAKSC